MGLLDRYQAIIDREEGAQQGNSGPSPANAQPAAITNRELAFDYCMGCNGYPQDDTKALEHAKKALQEDGNDPIANLVLGELYYWGRYVQKNFMEAKKYYEKAAANGEGWAQFMMFDIYYYARLGMKNVALAYDYLRQSLKNATENQFRYWVGRYDTGHTGMVVAYHAFEAGLQYSDLFLDVAKKNNQELYGPATMAKLYCAVLGNEDAKYLILNYADRYTGNTAADYLARRDYEGWARFAGISENSKPSVNKALAYGFGIGVPKNLALVEKMAKGFLAEKGIKDAYESAKDHSKLGINDVFHISGEELVVERYEELMLTLRTFWGYPDDESGIDTNAYYLYQMSLTHPEIREFILKMNPFTVAFERRAEK